MFWYTTVSISFSSCAVACPVLSCPFVWYLRLMCLQKGQEHVDGLINTEYQFRYWK